MTIKCLGCGYEMEITQAMASSALHILGGILPKPTTKGFDLESLEEAFKRVFPQIVAGIANQEFGSSMGVKCPACGKTGSWEG